MQNNNIFGEDAQTIKKIVQKNTSRNPTTDPPVSSKNFLNLPAILDFATKTNNTPPRRPTIPKIARKYGITCP